jgi:hypothetical protein
MASLSTDPSRSSHEFRLQLGELSADTPVSRIDHEVEMTWNFFPRFPEDLPKQPLDAIPDDGPAHLSGYRYPQAMMADLILPSEQNKTF